MSVLTVSQLNFYLKSILDEDDKLSNLFISGEISNFNLNYKSGHFYFSLKDENSVIKCVMFSSYNSRLKFVPQDGMKVILRGNISVYSAAGNYQIYVEDIMPDGIGELALSFEQTKEKLLKKGFFDQAHKLALPNYPERIGIITSKTGAAVKDVESVLTRRFPIAKLILFPVLVQGEGSAEQIIDALKYINEKSAVDVIIICRGGGSTEDLWCFNDENLAISIYNSKIPIISAVGHEVDFTICDFVSDLRAPTPSAAAELAVKDKNEVIYDINFKVNKIKNCILEKISYYEKKLNLLLNKMSMLTPVNIIDSKISRLEILVFNLKTAFEKILEFESNRLEKLSLKLNELNPSNILSRGYSMALTFDNKIIKSSKQVSLGQEIKIITADGVIKCKVEPDGEE